MCREFVAAGPSGQASPLISLSHLHEKDIKEGTLSIKHVLQAWGMSYRSESRDGRLARFDGFKESAVKR